jgi:amidase
MKVRDYVNFDGVGLAELIAKREIKLSEVAEAAGAAIDTTNPAINAIVERWSSAPAENAELGSPLYGVPMLVKDLALAISGRKNEIGSKLAEGLVMEADSNLAQRIKQAGLVMLGRTTTPEFGISSTTEARAVGPTRNPWNPDYNAGGSSGGSAAAVAAGMVPLAHATDGGGSIRVPASVNGVFGFKPSRGRVSLGPALDEVCAGLVVQLGLSRSVRDSAAMLDAFGAPAIGEPYYTLPPEKSFLTSAKKDPKVLKVGVTVDPPNGSRTARGVAGIFDQTAKKLSELGHTVEPVDFKLGVSWEAFVLASARLWALSTAGWVEFVALVAGKKINEENLERATIAIYEYGKAISGFDILEALATRNTVSRTLGEYFNRFDALMSPTLPDIPLKIGEYNRVESDVDGLGWINHVFTQSPFSATANMAGVPSMSVPSGFDGATGLPIGMMFTAGFGQDSTLFRLAGQLERAVPWKQYVPRVWAAK